MLRVGCDGVNEKDVVGRARAHGEIEEPVERRLGAFLRRREGGEKRGKLPGPVRPLHPAGDPARGVFGIVADGDAGRRRERVRLTREPRADAGVVPRLAGFVEERIDLFRREAPAAKQVRGFENHEPVRREESDGDGVRHGFLHAFARRLVRRDLSLREGCLESRRHAARALGHDPFVVSGQEEDRVKRRRPRRREERRESREGIGTLHGSIL